jgi:hypothetical protein
MNQDMMQDSLVAGGGNNFNTTTGYATGSICQFSGTYRASNKYMDVVQLYVAGDVFLAGADNKKTIWYALTSSLSTNKDGSFSSVKVAAGSA